MTVVAQDSKIFNPVICPVAICVVQTQWSLGPHPFGDAAEFAELFLQTLRVKPLFQVRSRGVCGVLDQDFSSWNFGIRSNTRITLKWLEMIPGESKFFS